MNSEAGRQAKRQTGKEGQSEGQIDRWMTYLLGKRSDVHARKQTGRRMHKLGKERERDGQVDIRTCWD